VSDEDTRRRKADEDIRLRYGTKVKDEGIRQRYQTKISEEDIGVNIRRSYQTKKATKYIGLRCHTKICDEGIRLRYQKKISEKDTRRRCQIKKNRELSRARDIWWR